MAQPNPSFPAGPFLFFPQPKTAAQSPSAQSHPGGPAHSTPSFLPLSGCGLLSWAVPPSPRTRPAPRDAPLSPSARATLPSSQPAPSPHARPDNPLAPVRRSVPLTARPHQSSPSPRPPLAQRPRRVIPQSSPGIAFPNYADISGASPLNHPATPFPPSSPRSTAPKP